MRRIRFAFGGFLGPILILLLLPGCWDSVRAGGELPPELLKVWQAYQRAVMAGDSNQVAMLSRFPIASNDFGGAIESPSRLRQRFKAIFRPEIVSCFANTEPRQVSGFPGYLVECGDALAFGFERHEGQYRFSYIDNANAE